MLAFARSEESQPAPQEGEVKVGDHVTAVIRNNASNAAGGINVDGEIIATAGDDPAKPTSVQIATGLGIYVWIPAADVLSSEA